MAVLICKNVKTEGPGTIGVFLKEKGVPYKVVDLSGGEDLPATEGFDTLVMMGAPMSVNESDIFPYINREEALVRKFASKGKSILGVCLGAQIMAKALGARVYKGDEKEIGWYDIELSEEAATDPLMLKLATHPKSGDLSKSFRVFHWHGETFDIPEGAVRLAGSKLFRNQAFRYGNRAYAFQFHIEVEKEMVYDWLKGEDIDLEKIKAETEGLYEIYNARAKNFYGTFFASGVERRESGAQLLTRNA